MQIIFGEIEEVKHDSEIDEMYDMAKEKVRLRSVDSLYIPDPEQSIAASLAYICLALKNMNDILSDIYESMPFDRK